MGKEEGKNGQGDFSLDPNDPSCCLSGHFSLADTKELLLPGEAGLRICVCYFPPGETFARLYVFIFHK